MGKCEYCFKESSDLKFCEIRICKPHDWTNAKWICGSCRNYLKGIFRYFKSNPAKGIKELAELTGKYYHE
jgi:hypothetical protein